MIADPDSSSLAHYVTSTPAGDAGRCITGCTCSVEAAEKIMPLKNPPHPGNFIRTEIVEAAGLTVTAAAIAPGVSRPALSSLLDSSGNLSVDMALRIEKLLA